MEPQQDPHLSQEEELHAENNLLKEKLRLEHGMLMNDSQGLSPETENHWLKHVYAFEQQYKNAKRTSLYDYIGRPAFKKWDTLDGKQTTQELARIQGLLNENNVQVDWICECDDATLYKFITEELFTHEMDDMRIPGMTCHFTYEEFHPNHDYDIRQQVSDFLHTVFERRWEKEFHEFALAVNVAFAGKEHDRAAISAIITAFQEAHDRLKVLKLDITTVVINTELTMADVAAKLSACGKRQGEQVLYEGSCSFHLVREDGYWFIDGFRVPGME